MFDLLVILKKQMGWNHPKHLARRILLNIHPFKVSLTAPKDVR